MIKIRSFSLQVDFTCVSSSIVGRFATLEMSDKIRLYKFGSEMFITISTVRVSWKRVVNVELRDVCGNSVPGPKEEVTKFSN